MAGIDRIVTGKLLNHASVDRDTVTGMIYDRHSYDEEKRRAMERWADHLVMRADLSRNACLAFALILPALLVMLLSP
jgi:hypothetical protein